MISDSKPSRRRCLAICDNGESHFLPEERIFWKEMPSIRMRQQECQRFWGHLTLVIFEKDYEKALNSSKDPRTLEVLQSTHLRKRTVKWMTVKETSSLFIGSLMALINSIKLKPVLNGLNLRLESQIQSEQDTWTFTPNDSQRPLSPRPKHVSRATPTSKHQTRSSHSKNRVLRRVASQTSIKSYVSSAWWAASPRQSRAASPQKSRAVSTTI